jgi:autotransporter-associated beta strand protein
LDLSGGSTYTGVTTVSGGVLTLGEGTLTLATGTTTLRPVEPAQGTLTLSEGALVGAAAVVNRADLLTAVLGEMDAERGVGDDDFGIV